MFKKISVTALALALAISMSSCAATIKELSDPSFTQAVNNSKNLATAFVCGFVVPGAALSTDIANLVNAGKAAIDTTGKVSAVSSAVCSALVALPDLKPVPQAPATVVSTPAVTLPSVTVTTPAITITAPTTTAATQ